MNYYEILEVSPNASPEVIKAAYKSLMQRYHPDRNPDNAGIAERASLVVQAYEVLSDANTRVAYDFELNRQLTDHISSTRNKSRDVQPPTAFNRRTVVKVSKSYWFLWLLITLIIISGWLILTLSKKRQSPESELQEIRLSFEGNQLTKKQMQEKFKRMDEIFRGHPEILKKEAGERAKAEGARTIPIFTTKLTVNLRVPDKPSEASGHDLTIPILIAKVGAFDAEKVILHMEKNNEYINQKLAGKLVYAKYEELVRIDGEQYLKKIILDSLGEITGTNRFEDYPSSGAGAPERYGVVEVLLPESFSVH